VPRHSKQDPGVRRIGCCTILHRCEVMVLMRCTFFFYLLHLSVGTYFFTRSRPPETKHMFAVGAFFCLELDYCEF